MPRYAKSHAGLAVASYLSALKIDFAILDREKEVGDAWAKRYDSATLHTTRVFSGLPYVPFPRDYPEFVGAKDIARYYKTYVKDLNLPIYQGVTAQKADWDETKKQWTVKTDKGTIITKSLIFANGIGGRWPIVPNYPGQDSFKGIMMHSIEYTNPEQWKGKKVAVVGASTTGIDVGWDCSQMGIDVTVVQRGPTRIYAPDHIKNIQKIFWNDETGADYGDAMTTEDPVALQHTLSALLMKMYKDEYDPAYYEGLEKAGFLAIHDGPVHNQIFCHGGKRESSHPLIGHGTLSCALRAVTSSLMLLYSSLIQTILTSAQDRPSSIVRSRSSPAQPFPASLPQASTFKTAASSTQT